MRSKLIKHLTQLVSNHALAIQHGVLALFALFALLSLGFSYHQQTQITRSENIAKTFYQLQSQYAQWQQSLLVNQNRYNPNFDQPERLYHQLQTTYQQLQHQLGAFDNLSSPLSSLQQSLKQDKQWMHIIKSQMALYKNSYHYLPDAITQCLAQVTDPHSQQRLLHIPLSLKDPVQFKKTLHTLTTDPHLKNCPTLIRHLQILQQADTQQRRTFNALLHSTTPTLIQQNYQNFLNRLEQLSKTNQRLFLSLHLITLLLLWLIYSISQSLFKTNQQLQKTSQQLQKQRNLYQALSELNQAISRTPDLDTLLQETTEIIQRYTYIPINWIGEIDSTTQHILPLTSHGISIETLKQHPITLTGNYAKTQVLADKIYADKHRAIVQDYVKEKKNSPFYHTLLQFGVRSMAIYPIHENNEIKYLLFLYSHEKNFFDPATDKLLNELVEDIELALQKHLLEQKHLEAEEALKIAAIAFESQEAIIITDAQEKIIRANQACEQMYGYTEDELLGQKPNIFRSDKHPDTFFQTMWQTLLNEGRWQGEIWNRTQSGKIIPVYETITAVKDTLGRITHYIGHSVDLTKEKEAQRQIEQLQHYDPLTNLPNRKFLLTQLEYFQHQHDLQGILIILNISDFKHINDALGTQVGDLLLMSVAQRLDSLFDQTVLQNLFETSFVARTSADEFVILVGIDTQHISLQKAALQLLTQLQTQLDAPFALGKETQKVHFYYGITLIPDASQENPTDWLRQADIALHHAKKQPQHPLAFYQAQMQEEVEQLHHMENALRQALQNNEFVMYYQPQICLRTGRVVGAETLIRWQKPNGELIPPFQFIPVLENSNLMVKTGYWIIDNILNTIKNEPLILDNQIQISINLSAQQFQDSQLDRNILQRIQQHQFPAKLLEFEVTESLLMENLNTIKAQLQTLQQHQIKIAIDDFGTGYSSFAYLKEFEVNKIKIDKTFIDHITQTKDQAIAQAIIDMSQALGAIAIAEGVETDAQLHTLAKLNCDEIQGYYYSKPLPFTDFLRFIQQNDTLPS